MTGDECRVSFGRAKNPCLWFFEGYNYISTDFSHKKIGEMLQISEGTSKSNLSRARLILKQKITEYQIKNQKASHVR